MNLFILRSRTYSMDMRKFGVKCVLFLLLNLLPFFVMEIIRVHVALFRADGNAPALFSVPKNQDYDVVLLGSSRTMVFSRGSNQDAVEKILDARFLNLARNGGGIIPEEAYLLSFFQRENTTKQVIYFIDAFVLFDSRWNEKRPVRDEPFEIAFLYQMMKSGFDRDILVEYARSVLSLHFERHDEAIEEKHLSVVDTRLLTDVKDYYKELSSEKFVFHAEHLAHIPDIVASHGAQLIFIIPPFLWQNDPGEDALTAVLSQLKREKGIRFYDLSHAVKNPFYFQDSNHLNRDGVQYFTEYYLKKIIAGEIPETER